MQTTGPFDVLQECFTGELILPGDPSYDLSRRVFNAMIDRRPAVIARCASTDDVVAAVRFARETGLVAAVRCGGHSVTGLGVCDDGIVIDLGGLRTIDVDPLAKTARVGGGVLWGDLDAATQQHGLHTPGGRITTTGIGGFTTGGGYGWTSSKYGLACDNLVSAEVVLADGRGRHRERARERRPLLGDPRRGRQLRGRHRIRVPPARAGPIVLAGLALWPLERGPEVMRAWRDHADAACDEVSTACVVITAPPEPFVPDQLKGETRAGYRLTVRGRSEEGVAAAQPLKDLGPDVDQHRTNAVHDLPGRARRNCAARSAQLLAGRVPVQPVRRRDRHVHARRRGTRGRAPPLSQAVIFRIGQGVTAVPDDATPFSHRDANYLFHPIAGWSDPADDHA